MMLFEQSKFIEILNIDDKKLEVFGLIDSWCFIEYMDFT